MTILDEQADKKNQPVTCLGMTFANDAERRAYFTEELRKKLPELKQMEGFPIGEDEDILALSDPPYYTACPNPFIPEFIKQWEKEKRELYGDEEEEYHREPFAADVSEGKGDPIYNAHSYHTKVPHKAIMRYILHYTKPGDIIYDGFSGTGMTGVAAGNCGDIESVLDIGYHVKDNGIIIDENGNLVSKLGERKCILNDLSPVASFIAYNYNSPVDSHTFENEAMRIIEEVEEECSWMFETEHVINGEYQQDSSGTIIKGSINYTIWSDVFLCPDCLKEIVFWDVAIDHEKWEVKDVFLCPSCNAELTKRRLERAWETKYDDAINQTITQVKQIPVLINYSVYNKRYEKRPDSRDLEKISKIDELKIPYWFPKNVIPKGEKTVEPLRIGITHIHHFYTKRNLWVLSSLYNKINAVEDERLRSMLFMLVSSYNLTHSTKMSRIIFKKSGTKPVLTGYQSGTLYVSSMPVEKNIYNSIRNMKVDLFCKAISDKQVQQVVGTQSTTKVELPPNSIDYIFTDPPFGANLMYSELNLIWEAWLGILTNSKPEAIINEAQEKMLPDYQKLIEECFREYFRVLKPGRWMTVEFSNSQASVWNVIQESIQRAGFVIANVSALDKKQGSFNAVTSTTAVKQDLVISAYKPSDVLIQELRTNQNTEESAWSFIREHLNKLPIFIGNKGQAQIIVERTPRVLFDRMVAYHVQNGLTVPISSAEFQRGITQRFPMRDGMVFLDTQVAEYDKKRILAKEFVQMNLFVSDENSAIEWLRQQLMIKPQTRQDLHPNFMKEIQHIAKYEKLPELDELLEQNFLKYDGTGPVPSQIHSYLSSNYKDMRDLDKEDPKLQAKAKNRWYVPDPNKAVDLEKLREKFLLREFASYMEEIKKSKKKLKQFRIEAIRAGFKKAWGDKDYQTIVDIGQRLPESILQEDDKLLMYYDNAQIRLGM